MKKVLLLAAINIYVLGVKAQGGYNYSEYAIGFGTSYAHAFTSVDHQNSNWAYNANIIYNYSPFLQFGGEIQVGKLSGGGLTADKDKYGRQYTDNYKAFLLHLDIQLGEGVDYSNNFILNAIKSFYVGTGMGIIVNNDHVQRTNAIDANGSRDYVFPGADNSVSLFIPIRLGYEIKIYNQFDEPSYSIDIGYIHNIAFNSLDGYNDPPSKFKHFAMDQYRQFAIGIKYHFGNITAYTKSIRN